MPRVVLDTNVVISGLLFGGPPGAILDLIVEGLLDLAVSAELSAELERVLRNKFPGAQHAVWETVMFLKEIGISTVPTEQVQVVVDDPSDNRVLECALSAHADVIVSGDHHLLTLKTFRGIPILSPQTFLASWREKRP